MAVSVLIIDDSQFFRQRVRQLLTRYPDISIVGEASNGREGVEKALALKPDIITMDYEMPLMDGIAALREVRKHSKIPVIMLSSLTFEGARLTISALEAGAADFMVKSQLNAMADGRSVLYSKIRALTQGETGAVVPTEVSSPSPEPTKARASVGRPGLLVIGASTGGPLAIKHILEMLPVSFPIPVLVVQHMPARFTGAFAERLNEQCSIKVLEAHDGQQLHTGVAYVAPGGKQLLIEKAGGLIVRVVEGTDARLYKPSVDVTFGSAAKAMGAQALGVVLTGMGDDGTRGARLLRSAGARIWVQEAQSCVVNGMPQSVRNANLADEVLTLTEIGKRLMAFR